ncbi:MAG: M1 family metallopeptidase [Bacteroidia bacterium]
MKRAFYILALLFPFVVFSQSYWQQRVNYKIDVKLNDEKHEISGFENIEYSNHSADTLGFIYFHLWPNAYKDNSSALAKQYLERGDRNFYFAPDSDKGFIDSLDFRANGVQLKIEYDKNNPDICKIYLDKTLLPGEKVNITTPFRVKIPSCRFSRLGHDQQAYYISQWYPKPAVYDATGWNPMPYLDQGEFYSEFGSYDVSITLPENYLLAATGERYDSPEEEAFLNAEILKTEKVLRQLDSGKYAKDLSFPASSGKLKTVRFKQDNVHDFAWFADKRFHVLKGDLTLPHSKRTVYTWAFFTDDEINVWRNSLNYLSDATFYYSLWNGDYAYNHVTAIDGVISAGGGMEYPMITIIGKTSEAFNLDVVITHEVGHNWFYGMLGSNERKHAWMDEGINSFNEMRYVRTKYPRATVADMIGRDSTFHWLRLNKYKQDYSYYFLYAMQAKRNADQPNELPSDQFSEFNYGAIVYSKTAILFNYLMNYMGEGDFDIAMQFYFEQCKMKHPNPTDLRKVLEYFSEKKLDWFFDDLIGTTKKLDYKVVRYTKGETDDNYFVEVKNTGDVKGPVSLCATKNGKIVGMIWYEGFEGSKILEFPPVEMDAFKIDYFNFMPEVNRKNNTIRTHGLFKKTEPLKASLIASLDDPDKTQMFFSPALSYNMYNGLMAGLAYYNHTVFEKKFETELVPMYATGNNDISGLAGFHFNLHPDKVFSSITLHAKAGRFAYEQNVFTNNYNKFTGEVDFEFKNKSYRSPFTHKFGYRYVEVMKEFTNYLLDTTTLDYRPFKDNFNYGVHDFVYLFSRSDALRPFNFKLNFQAGNDVQKISLTYNAKFYVSRSHYFEVRAFAGKMLYMNPYSMVDYRFRTSGWTGSNDYLYDYSYVGRSEYNGFPAAQFSEVDGAFKTYTPLGQTADWIGAINIKSPRIFKLPLLIYADFATTATDGFAPGQSNFLYNAGVDIIIARDICELFIPLSVSKNIEDVNNLNKVDFVHQIRFVFNLNKVNPFTILKQLVDF